jgi:hypothetical protein
MAESALGTFRVDKDLWTKFQKLAKGNDTNASKLIVGFIKACIDDGIDIKDYTTIKAKPELDNLSERIDIHLDENLADRVKVIMGSRLDKYLDKSDMDANAVQKMVNESIEVALEPIEISVSKTEAYTKLQIEAVRGELMAVKKLSAIA